MEIASRSHPAPGDALDLLGIAPAAVRIVRYFLIRPGAEPHARELQRVLGLGGASLQRELGRLLALGALERRRDGGRVRYRAIDGSPVWRALAILERASHDPTDLVRNAVVDVPGVLAAFIFGSTARGERRADSDIDLFVLEDASVDRRKLFSQLAEVELLAGREVDAVRYTAQSLRERLEDASHPASAFVREALLGPKRWIAGGAAAIAALAPDGVLPAAALAGSPA